MIILIRTNKISVFLLQDRERVSFNGIEWVMKCPNKNRAFGEWSKQIRLSIKRKELYYAEDSSYTFKAVIEAYRLQSRLILFLQPFGNIFRASFQCRFPCRELSL